LDVLSALRARFDFVEEYMQFLLGTRLFRSKSEIDRALEHLKEKREAPMRSDVLMIKCSKRNNVMNIAVIGGSTCSKKIYKQAQELGALIAKEGWTLVCGGLSGVMEAACRGAKGEGGITVGILPGNNCKEANKYVDVKIPTGLGYARNILVVRAAKVVVAIDGKYGTLSEISFALNEGKPVIGIGTWDIKGIIKVKTPGEAINHIKKTMEK
jgi:uncharacterized protein (TIGR00725 family)